MARGVEDRDLGWDNIKKDLKKLGKMGVKVGIVEGSGEHDGVSVAEYAAYNEEGTKHIPSRPFIRSWVDNNQEQINKVMDSVYGKVLNGEMSAEDAVKRIGAFGQSGIRENIAKGDFKPNDPKTVKRKGSSKPLIDSGTMRNSIRYEVVKKR